MIVRDWRDADPADTQVLYAREQEYWVRELAWDASTAWREIEQARVTWGLLGFLAIDTDRTLRGWAYFLPEGETGTSRWCRRRHAGGHESAARCLPGVRATAAATRPRFVFSADSRRRVRRKCSASAASSASTIAT